MTYTTASYQLDANAAKRLKIFLAQIASTSIDSFAACYQKIAAKISSDNDFSLTAVEFNSLVSVLDDFSAVGDYGQIRDDLIAQAPSNDAYAPEIMAISIIGDDAPDVDCGWLYDVHNDVMDGNITFADSYRMTQGFMRGLIAPRLVGIEAISDLDRSMQICGGNDKLEK